MKEAAKDPEAVAEAPAPQAATALGLGPTAAGRVLALQRTAGNRAVAHLLARADTTTVSKFVKEETTTAENVTWTASFDVTFDDDASPPTCWLTIKVRLNPDEGISKDEVSDAKVRALSRFNLLWDSKFVLHEHRTIRSDRDYLLRPGIKFVDKGEHITVNLHRGKGHDNRQNWYLESPEWTYAHEISHQMGLLDEYADVTVPTRKVYADHSIMGDYYNEGMTEATGKLRHGERLASIIGAATDRELTARMR